MKNKLTVWMWVIALPVILAVVIATAIFSTVYAYAGLTN